MGNEIRVLIADDHAILRAGLRLLIEAEEDLEVVGEAETGAEAVELTVELEPHVVLMDLSMPGGGGIAAIHQIRRRRPETRVVALTMHDDPAYVRSVLAAGGIGYVVKRAADDQLLTAIRSAHAGLVYVTPPLAQPAPGPQSSGVPATALSPREREVLALLARGYTNRQAGERLGVSVKTVETYRARLCEKLGVKSRADLVRYALDTGLLEA